MTATLPAALDSERTVIGGIIMVPRLYADVAGILTPEEFYHPANQAIFAAMGACDASGSPIDVVSILAAMTTAQTDKRLGALGGEAYFSQCTSDCVTVENLPWHARRIRAKSERRRWIEVADMIRLAGYGDGDDDEFFEASEKAVAALSIRSAHEGPAHIKSVLRDTMHAVEARYKAKQSVTGVPSGHDALDEAIGGFQPGDLVVIAGRPSMGKTALAMGMVQHAATGRNCNRVVVPALVFSLEMMARELAQRMVSSDGNIEGTRLRNGFMEQGDWIRFVRSAGELADAPIHVYDKSATFARIRSESRRWRAAHTDAGKDALIVIDYLGLIASDAKKGKNEIREQEVAGWTRGLKALGKELRAVIVLLAQLNRAVESRADKRPMMSDLRESGAIEQDADLVLFPYRDEVYDDDTRWKGIAECIIGKARNAATGMVPLRFEGAYTRFSDCPPGDVPTSEEKPTRGKANGYGRAHYGNRGDQ